MGKLRTSLTSAATLVKGVEKSIKETSEEFAGLSSNAYQLMHTGAAGIDELYLYITQKLKANKLDYKTVENNPISTYADVTVVKFLQGIVDLKKKALEPSSRWESLGQGLHGDLKRVEEVLNDVFNQIKKKKKKLLQSKKYKAKIATYEEALQEVLTKAQNLHAELKKLLKNGPPTVTNIQEILNIKPSSTLKELDALASIEIQNLMEKYKDLKETTTESTRKFREAGDFASELKTIQQMVSESDDIEVEGND